MQYADIKHRPNRSEFIDQAAHKIILEDIKNSADLYFMPISIEEQNWGAEYKVFCFGIFPDGSKVCIRLMHVPIYFDVRLDKKMIPQDILELLDYKWITSYKIVKGMPFKLFYKEKQDYLRIFCSNLRSRKAAILKIRSFMKSDNQTRQYETASDDCVGVNYYFMKLAREMKYNTTSWNRLQRYHRPKEPLAKNCAFEFMVHYADMFGLEDTKDIEAEYVRRGADNMCFTKDKTIVATWDIETYSFGEQTGQAPRPEDDNYVIFCICSTFHYQYDDMPFLRVAICDVESNAPPNADIVVIAKTSERVIRAFIRILGNMTPDIITGFNSGGFDTPLLKAQVCKLIKNKAGYNHGLYYMDKHLNALHNGAYLKTAPADPIKLKTFQYGKNGENGINKWKFSMENVKISADKFMSQMTMKFSGLIDIDVMVIFMGLYPTYELNKRHSLNHFLAENGLESKEDMAYKKMFSIYERALAKNENVKDDMALVLSYCITDALRCQQLLVKRTVVADKREISNISFVTLYDAFYRANGKKVRNLVGAIAYDFNIMFSNVLDDGNIKKINFPGAWVFPPIKGVNKERPVTGLDFSSLYPSLIMTYNLSPEKLIKKRSKMERLKAEGYHIHEIKFNELGTNKEFIGWTVRHNNNLTPNKSETLAGENMGLFGYILKLLFDKRAILKGHLIKLSCLNEKLLLGKDEITPADITNTEFEGAIETFVGAAANREKNISQVQFFKNKVDSKQKALKVYMNTFYGESGSVISSIYEVLIAGGITSAGRYNIQMVADFLEHDGFKIWYGDTDSVYVSCPDALFSTLDAEYQAANITKIEYWTQMVRLTQDAFIKCRGEVNAMLVADNGTQFLKMAYEEVLFPVVFTGKKKYFGFQHMKNINFNPTDKNIFVRGMDFIKQGKSPLAYLLGYEIMRESCSIECTKSLKEVVLSKVSKLYFADWNIKNFVTSAKYKKPNPGRPGNIAVKTCVERIKKHKQFYEERGDLKMALNYEVPEYGDSFQYVVVKPSNLFDVRGYKISDSVGSRMELLAVYNATQDTPNPMKIDLSYYADSSIFTIFARFISYENEFQPENAKEMDFTEIDKFSTKEAKNYIMKCRDELIGVDKQQIAAAGRMYKKYYKDTIKRLNLGCRIDLNVRHDAGMKYKIIEYVKKQCDYMTQTDKTYERMARTFKTRDELFKIRVLFLHSQHGICNMRLPLLKAKESELYKRMDAQIMNIIQTSCEFEDEIEQYILLTRNEAATSQLPPPPLPPPPNAEFSQFITELISIKKLINDNMEEIERQIDYFYQKLKT